MSEGDQINVGVFVVHGPGGERESLEAFAIAVTERIRERLEDATGLAWAFHLEDAHRIADDEPRRPSSFVDEAALRMVSGPYDIVVTVTNVGLNSRRNRIEPGLASPVARMIALSSHRLRMTGRGEALRALQDSAVVVNGAALLLRLVGRVLGLRGEAEGAMAPFRFDPDRAAVPEFSAAQREKLQKAAPRIPEREQRTNNHAGTAVFYVTALYHHGGEVLHSLWRNRAPLLPLSLPALSTAAIAPALILIFSAETWDVGLHMTNGVSLLSGAISIVAATFFLVFSHNLLFPHKEKRLLTEHLAVVNVTVLASIFLAVVGLFVMLGLIILAIELWIFPPGLIAAWPSLEDPDVDSADFLRLAVFVSTLGVISGALGGGLENRSVIRHLALFLDEP